MNAAEKIILQQVADTIRVLSAEAVEKATCGHPGLPLGCAEIGAYLYTHILRHNPKNPNWPGRDRFVLSAGHGSMFLYSLLHLTGYALPMEELKNFRQLGSKTPGHPEYGMTPGVETTTGPLGQGIASATGMAIANRWLRERFGRELCDAKIYALGGDGCMMEGISHEAGSLAGHLKLDNLVIIYDSNHICLDGPTSETFTDDTAKRYESYGFRVLEMNGNDLEQVAKTLTAARDEREKPVFIVAHTIIGKGAPKKQGTSAAHGAKLGADEVAAMKKNLGWPDEAFYVPGEVTKFMQSLQTQFAKYESDWNGKLAALKSTAPEKGKLWDIFAAKQLPSDFDDQIWNMKIDPNKAGRQHSQAVIGKVAELLPFFVTGSADLSVSDSTNIKASKNVNTIDWNERNFKFGVREFSMAAECYGMELHGMIQPLCGTFLTFSDYMRNAIRVCSIMKKRVLFQFTHDSIWLGEDGPTHQPVEHYAALRAIPHLAVIRPFDENEVKAAWIQAFKTDGPVAFILSRQSITSGGELTATAAREGVAKGAYILKGYHPTARVDVSIVATGSEVAIALEVSKLLEAQGKSVRIVSMPCWEYFDAQPEEYRKTILGGEVGLRVSLEAGVTQGWHKYIGSDGLAIGIDRFGESAPDKDLLKFFGFTPEQLVERITAALPVSA